MQDLCEGRGTMAELRKLAPLAVLQFSEYLAIGAFDRRIAAHV